MTSKEIEISFLLKEYNLDPVLLKLNKQELEK